MDQNKFMQMLQLVMQDPDKAYAALAQSGYEPPDIQADAGKPLQGAQGTGMEGSPELPGQQPPGPQPSNAPQQGFGRALGSLQSMQPPTPHYFPAVGPRVNPGVYATQAPLMQMLMQGTQPQNLPSIARLALPQGRR